MELEFNKTNIIIILSFLIIVFLTIYIVDKPKEETKNNKNREINLVNDYTDFFSISNSANKFISTVQKKDIDNVLILLNDQYIKENKINDINLFSKIIPFEEGIYNFEAKKMYYQNLTSNLVRYYLYGKIDKETIDDSVYYKDYYLIIDLDKENSLFAVTPYDGAIFMED